MERALEISVEPVETPDDIAAVRELFREYAEFMETVKQWQALQVQKVHQGRKALATEVNTRFRELEISLKMQRKRLAMLTAQLSV